VQRAAVAANVQAGAIEQRTQFSERELAARQHLAGARGAQPRLRPGDHAAAGFMFGGP
jgi:hypothetical protein